MTQKIMAHPGVHFSSPYVYEGQLILRHNNMGLLYSTFSNTSCIQILLGVIIIYSLYLIIIICMFLKKICYMCRIIHYL